MEQRRRSGRINGIPVPPPPPPLKKVAPKKGPKAAPKKAPVKAAPKKAPPKAPIKVQPKIPAMPARPKAAPAKEPPHDNMEVEEEEIVDIEGNADDQIQDEIGNERQNFDENSNFPNQIRINSRNNNNNVNNNNAGISTNPWRNMNNSDQEADLNRAIEESLRISNHNVHDANQLLQGRSSDGKVRLWTYKEAEKKAGQIKSNSSFISFSGSDAIEFVRRLEHETHMMPEYFVIDVLYFKLSPELQRTFNDHFVSGPHAYPYSTIKTWITTIYGDLKSSIKAMEELAKLKWLPNKNFNTFFNKFIALTAPIYGYTAEKRCHELYTRLPEHMKLHVNTYAESGQLDQMIKWLRANEGHRHVTVTSSPSVASIRNGLEDNDVHAIGHTFNNRRYDRQRANGKMYYSKDREAQREEDRKNNACYYCHIPNHRIFECRKRKRDLDNQVAENHVPNKKQKQGNNNNNRREDPRQHDTRQKQRKVSKGQPVNAVQVDDKSGEDAAVTTDE